MVFRFSDGLPFVTLAFAFYLLSFTNLVARPGLVFGLALGADLCLLAVALASERLQRVHVLAGSVGFLLLAAWTMRLSDAFLPWALGLYLGFAVLHTGFPIVLARFRGVARSSWWAHLFPPLGLLLMLVALMKLNTASLLIWPVILLIDLLAIGLAVFSASAISILAAMLLTAAAAGVTILLGPAELTGLSTILTVVGGFAVFFCVASVLAGQRILARNVPLGEASFDSELGRMLGINLSTESWVAQTPALSAITPFLLLIMLSLRLPINNPTPIFALGMGLLVLLLGLGRWAKLDLLAPVGLASVLILQLSWHQGHFQPDAFWTPLLWYLAFYGVVTAFPFASKASRGGSILPWAASALAGPLHFYLIYRAISPSVANPWLGLVPALFAVPMFCALAYLARTLPESPERLNLLAWYGGCALFFVTLIFPIEFERQWITIGWALEGVALLWLFHRLPHPGLRATGVVLLLVSFARLALNPAVLEYHRNTGQPLFNWYLYAYGLVAICLMAGARLLIAPQHLVWKQNVRPILYGLGTVLAFLLVNIEIADYFSEGDTLTFQFSGNFARDMSYSIAWGLFALVLLVVGISKRLPPSRYAALGLLATTLLKLFLHDLSRLDQLYRIGAFVAVAVILILASFLYQRFIALQRT